MGGRSREQQARSAALWQRIRELLALKTMTHEEIAAEVGCYKSLVEKTKRRFVRPPWKRNESRLSLDERVEIAAGLKMKESLRAIAKRLGRDPSTISREVKKQLKGSYQVWRGEELAEKNSRRPKPRKLECNEGLRLKVEEGLAMLWSPQQIANRLKAEQPDDPEMQVSHETIYRTLYVQGRGVLRKELAATLRMGPRTRRRRRTRSEGSNFLRATVNISQRPPEANDRAVPGHWEGDLIKGALNKSCIGTLVERSTRYVMLLHLPNGGSAQEVEKALKKKIQQLPVELRRSLTWDQGAEMARHASFSMDTGMAVYFCDPHSPWQRGSNENTNGLLRQYFPKGEDYTDIPEERLDEVARQMNGRPRETLNWRTPAEALNEFLRLKAA
jgi:IS30 family transposase